MLCGRESPYQFVMILVTSIQYLGVITLSLEPAPLGAKHVRCSAPSRVRVPRVGVLESPQSGLHSRVGGGSRTRDAAEKSWPEVRPFDAPLAGRARLPAKSFR